MKHCRECEVPLDRASEESNVCPDCRAIMNNSAVRLDAIMRGEPDPAPQPKPVSKQLSHIILTTESSSALAITERLGIISAECVLGMNIFKDLGTSLRDIFGGRSAGYQDVLREARITVLDEIRRQAFDLDADAVVAIDLDYSEISGGGKSMLFLVASGTAVRLDKGEINSAVRKSVAG